MGKRQTGKPNSTWENGMRICESVIRIVNRFKWFRTPTSCGLFQIMSDCMSSTIYKIFLGQTQNYNFLKKICTVQFLKLICR